MSPDSKTAEEGHQLEESIACWAEVGLPLLLLLLWVLLVGVVPVSSVQIEAVSLEVGPHTVTYILELGKQVLLEGRPCH